MNDKSPIKPLHSRLAKELANPGVIPETIIQQRNRVHIAQEILRLLFRESDRFKIKISPSDKFSDALYIEIKHEISRTSDSASLLIIDNATQLRDFVIKILCQVEDLLQKHDVKLV